ncbi:MAG: hypothetical protein IJD47_05070 [Clostridia bacterium]|nr:hypothetical protein [Clostridia bacterium]
MDNRDIFDEEFDRLNLNQGEEPTQQSQFDSWSGAYNVYQQPEPKRQNKPFKIVFTAILMVVCIALGWVLAVITNDKSINDERQEILDKVFDYMDYNFYQEISEEEWQLAVEQAGSALMQYAGDQFSFLMSPQTYYDYIYGSSTVVAASSMDELFGMTYQMETKGMLVTDVMPDSASYGYLQAGDLIVKMSNIKEYIPILDANGNLQQEEDGSLKVRRNSNKEPILDSVASDFVLEGLNATQAAWYLQFVYSADFYVLRNGSIYVGTLTRNKVGISYDEKNIDPNKRYDFKFVEYYISDSCNNISTTAINGAGASTYEVRGLDNLPAKTAYVHLLQFDQIVESDDTISHSCDKELKEVLQMFADSNCEYLVLDLKGNPGGSVPLTVNIAGMLIHPNNLTEIQRAQVELGSANSPKYLVTKLVDRQGRSSDYTITSTYYNYFPQTELANNKKRIIVWTDGGSASASELLTGTLLDYQTAVHMGTNTYGKGIAQTIEELNITGKYVDVNGITHNDGRWYVYYTFAYYYSPLGTNIQGIGYAPSKAHQASGYNDLWTLAKGYWGV